MLDTSDGGIPGAEISLVNEDSGFRRTAHSNPGGEYRITSLQPGGYRIVVRKAGFRTVIRFGIRLDGAEPLRLNVTLPVGSMQDTITVEGSAPMLTSDSATVATLVLHDEMERLPLNGRGVLSLLELAPGTIATPATRGEPGQFTVNGQRPNANYFMVDGVSANTGVSGGGGPAQATGGALPGLSAYGSMDAMLSLEAAQEFRVQTATAGAEFGRLPGASISLNSRSGSSDFHGSTLLRFRHEYLSANDWFSNRAGNDRAPLRMENFAQTFGGPILRNRTFFFLAYEGMRFRQSSAWRTPVPSLEARANAADWVRPILELFPVPNGPDLGDHLAEWTGRNLRPGRLDAGSVRIDHALTSRITLFGRYHQAPSSNEFGNVQVNRLELEARTTTFGADIRPKSTLVMDVRLNASHNSGHSYWSLQGQPPCALNALVANFLHNPGLCDDFVRFSIAGVGQLSTGPEGDRTQQQYQVLETTTWTHGSHALRIGLDYRRLTPGRHDDAGSLSVIAQTLNDLNDSRNLWSAVAAARQSSLAVKELSLFIVDTWRITPRLTLNAGLRWEYSPSPLPRENVYYFDPATNLLSQDRRPLWTDQTANLAPRLGVAWRPGPSEKTVLRAGGGVYYNSSLSIATDTVNGGPLNLSQHSSSIHAPFPSLLSYGFLPDLTLPYVAQWSAFVDHAFGARDTISAGYVGSQGVNLLRREMGGPGSSATVWVALATNHGESDYNGLQLQYRRRFAHGLQGLVSYTWSHSIDNSSSDALVYWAGANGSRLDRGNSDFDLRHSASAALTAELPKGWALDGMLRVRSGFPITVTNSEQYLGLTFAAAFRPNLVAGQPLWIDDGNSGGGRVLNPAAFRATQGTTQGTLGRNALTGFGMSQLDLALRRDFRVTDRIGLQLRVEGFNAFNRPNFADPVQFLDSPLFGQSPSMLNLMLGTGSPGSGLAPIFQTGSPRSFQLGLRLSF